MANDPREIFRYSKGHGPDVDGAEGPEIRAKGDPVQVDRRFLKATAGFELDDILKKTADENSDVREYAYGKLLPAIRAAFAVAELADDGTGLTEAETAKLLDEYCEWKNRVKPATGESPSSSPPTDSPSTASASLNPAASGPTAG